jgi:hypothetical protein
MKIKITEKDIINGVPFDSEACAISQALMREFNTNCVSTSMGKSKVLIQINEQHYFVDKKDQNKVKKFIYDFDNLAPFDNAEQLPPKPITFELNQ